MSAIATRRPDFFATKRLARNKNNTIAPGTSYNVTRMAG